MTDDALMSARRALRALADAWAAASGNLTPDGATVAEIHALARTLTDEPAQVVVTLRELDARARGCPTPDVAAQRAAARAAVAALLPDA